MGVVGRIRQDRLDAGSRIALYHPHARYPTRSMNVTLRSRTAVASLASSVREELRGAKRALESLEGQFCRTGLPPGWARE